MLLLNITELLGSSVSDELRRACLKKPKLQVSRIQGCSCSQSYVTRRSSLHVIISFEDPIRMGKGGKWLTHLEVIAL